MAKSASSSFKSKKRLKTQRAPVIQKPAPHLGDLEEFPSLTESLDPQAQFTSKRSTPLPEPVKVSELEFISEDGVCVGGTTYYMKPNLPEPITSMTLDAPCSHKESTRQFPAKATSLYEEIHEYPTLLAHYPPKTLRQAICEQLKAYLLFPEELGWVVCDNVQVFRERPMETVLGQQWEHQVYLSRDRVNGDIVTLRRLANFSLRNTRAVDICRKWRSVNHPNVARLRSITTTRAFRDSSVLFAYDYYPNSITLADFMISQAHLLEEDVIWCFSMQLLAGLHAIHSAKLAVRNLEERHVLLTGLDGCTLKIDCTAMVDVIEIANESQSSFGYQSDYCATQEHRAKDFRALGGLVNSMIKHCTSPITNELKDFGRSLSDGKIRSSDAAVASLGCRILDYTSLRHRQKEILEIEICKEVDNGRLFRLLFRIFEKLEELKRKYPKPDDLFVLRLFVKYLFDRGCMYETISCLNQLDVGAETVICLQSYEDFPPNYTMIYVSYKELRQYLEDSDAGSNDDSNESNDSGHMA